MEMNTLKNKNFEMGEAVLNDNDSVAKIHKIDNDSLKKKSSK